MTAAIGRAWRRFRSLPVPFQVATLVAVLAAYSAVLVVLVGGGDSDSSSGGKRPLSALERTVKGHVEQGRVPQRSEADVSAFRMAKVLAVKCEANRCEVTYSVAVPGRGRLGLQQADIVRRIFGNTDVERLALTIVRGQPKGPQASPKSEEETPLGVPLFETECDRTKAPDLKWKGLEDALVGFSTACDFRGVFEGGPGGATGAPGSGAGGE